MKYGSSRTAIKQIYDLDLEIVAALQSYPQCIQSETMTALGNSPPIAFELEMSAQYKIHFLFVQKCAELIEQYGEGNETILNTICVQCL